MSWNVSTDGPVAIVAFDRGPENVMSLVDLRELDCTLESLSADPSISVVVLTSDVPGIFVAHADVQDINDLVAGRRGREGFERWLWTLLRIESITQPVIAAVQGQAWGGGCEIAAACMLRVGSPAATFSQLEVPRGALPGAGGTQRLPRIVGLPRATEMILTGRVIDAAEALRIGLLDALLDGPDFRRAALEWVEPIASQPRSALAAAKRAIVDGQRLPLMEGLLNEQRLFRQQIALRREASRE